jgi:hypothetical protein
MSQCANLADAKARAAQICELMETLPKQPVAVEVAAILLVVLATLGTLHGVGPNEDTGGALVRLDSLLASRWRWIFGRD